MSLSEKSGEWPMKGEDILLELDVQLREMSSEEACLLRGGVLREVTVSKCWTVVNMREYLYIPLQLKHH